MNIHLSIDDVIESFLVIAENEPDSVFDVPFFNRLRKFHYDYGAVFSIYAFAAHYGRNFHISQVHLRYWKEIEESKFLRFGYHGSYKNMDFANFATEFNQFCDIIPSNLITNRLRLHRYSATSDVISFLAKNGVTELFCRDHETQLLFPNEPSYDLSITETHSLTNYPLKKNGMIYRKTDIRLELFESKSLMLKLKNYIECCDKQDTLVLFTHEKYLLEKAMLLDEALRYLKEHKKEKVCYSN